jgi:molybdate transport system ATP-binding protein
VKALDAKLAFSVGRGARAFRVEAELSLDAGVLVLFGPSGAGKTLTLQALAGLIPGVCGHMRVGGETLLDSARAHEMAAEARRVGYVPQQHALFPFADVAGNVAFGLPRAERRGPKVTALLDELGLAALAQARPASLSGGERQRVALGRALAVEPRLLLLDEPFASLDGESRAALGKTVRAVIDRHRVPAVLVTHDADEAMALGDRVVTFARGRTLAAGDPREVLGKRDRVSIRGTVEGAAEAAGQGRARVTVRDAVIEGPEDLVRGDEEGRITIER